jgi:nucleotide-binding universal stress UspA family protein
MYERIVIGYDESEASRAALEEASLWARSHGGSLLLVHAVYFDPEEFAIPPAQLEKGVEKALRFCASAKASIAATHALDRVDVIVREGEAPDVLASVAVLAKADLVAVGTFGRSGLKRLLVGSVTSEVIAKAPCDVLVVKRPHRAGAGRYGSILAPFDRSPFGRKALARALELAKAEGSKVTAVYVIPRYEEMVELLRTGAVEASLRAGAEKLLDEAREMASAHGVELGTLIAEGHAADEIVSAAARLGSDLVIMGTHGWRGVSRAIMGSTTNSVIAHAVTPVLVVK